MILVFKKYTILSNIVFLDAKKLNSINIQKQTKQEPRAPEKDTGASQHITAHGEAVLRALCIDPPQQEPVTKVKLQQSSDRKSWTTSKVSTPSNLS